MTAFILSALLLPVYALAQTVTMQVDGNATGKPLKTVWSWFGYDELNYTSTAPSRVLLDTVVAIQRDPVYIRTHFLLNTGDGKAELKWGSTNVYTEQNGNPVYDWKLLDTNMDAIIHGGAWPYAEIAFMPQALSTRPTPYKNSSVYALDGGLFYPPTDYTKWSDLISAWAQHSKDRYTEVESKWIWELWNEPNIGYWHGTPEEYQKLYDYTEQGLHRVLPGAILGGPETAGPGSFMRDFLTHCATGKNAATGQTGTRLDLVSFHAKGGTAVVNGHVRMDLGNQLKLHRDGFNIVAAFPQYKQKPIVVGEADPDGCAACPQTTYPADAYRNVPAYGAYEAAMMKHSLDLADSLGVNLKALVVWAWLFNDEPYFQGFRTLSTNGIHKPVLNVFKMLGKLQGERIPVKSSGGLATILTQGARGTKPDIDGFATRSDSTVQILLWNYHDDLVAVDPASITLTVTLPSTFTSSAKVTHYRMDTTHSNANTTWLAQGKPQNPTATQLAELKTAMQLQTLETPKVIAAVNGQVTLTFSLPRHGVSLVVLDKQAATQIGGLRKHVSYPSKRRGSRSRFKMQPDNRDGKQLEIDGRNR
jgi:xylan 1,4-beta-xylosidase